jgi:hypothetical protein
LDECPQLLGETKVSALTFFPASLSDLFGNQDREARKKFLQIERVGRGIEKILQRYLIALTACIDKLE